MNALNPTTLPEDAWWTVLSHLDDPVDLASCSLVNRKFRDFAKQMPHYAIPVDRRQKYIVLRSMNELSFKYKQLIDDLSLNETIEVACRFFSHPEAELTLRFTKSGPPFPSIPCKKIQAVFVGAITSTCKPKDLTRKSFSKLYQDHSLETTISYSLEYVCPLNATATFHQTALSLVGHIDKQWPAFEATLWDNLLIAIGLATFSVFFSRHFVLPSFLRP